MPEGPEVRRQASEIERAIGGSLLREVEFGQEALKPWESRLRGARVEAVRSRGKAFLIELSGEPVLTIYVHLQLFGLWKTLEAGQELPESGRSLRLRLEGERGTACLYSASQIEVLTPAELEAHRYLRKLGPDLLAGLEAESVLARLQSKRFRRRTLGALLLDQSFLAGLGNYLRSEVLFRAGLLPSARPQELSKARLERLAREALALAEQSFTSGGITNELSRAAALRAAGVAPRRARWWVFEREGEPCYQCEAPIERQEVGGRRCYLCLRCQR